MKFATVVLAGMLGASVLLASCGGGDGESSAGTVEFTVVTTDQLKYEPPELHVKEGERVIVHLDNSGGSTTHDLSIETIEVKNVQVDEPDVVPGHMHMDHLDLHIMLGAAQSGTITLTTTKAGTYEFFCTTPGHREAGMTGVLIVE